MGTVTRPLQHHFYISCKLFQMHSFISVLPDLVHMRHASVSSFSQARMISCRFEGWHWPSFQSVTPHTRERSSYICLLSWRLLHCAAAVCGSSCSPMLTKALLEGFLSSLPTFGEDWHSPSPLAWPEVLAVHTSVVWALVRCKSWSLPVMHFRFL